MTEIQFLASILLDDSLCTATKKSIIDRISELGAVKLEPFPNYPGVITTPFTTPYIGQGGTGTIVIDGCIHEYPNPWGGTVPPSCKKCGKSANPWYTVISTSGSFVS